jgi:hypothetical protein
MQNKLHKFRKILMEDKLDKIIELLEIIAMNSYIYNGSAKWSQEQENLVIDMFNAGKEFDEMIKTIKERFNIERTEGAISARISKLGLTQGRVKSNPKESAL